MASNILGPQISFTVNEGEKIWDPRLNKTDHHLLADSVTSFHSHHGTGSTFIEFCASALIHNIRKNNYNTNEKYIMSGLDLAMKAYIQSCDVLNMKLTEENLDHVPVLEHSTDPVAELPNDDINSETDWFFTDDIEAIAKDPYHELIDVISDYQHIVAEHDTYTAESHVPAGGSAMFSEEWVLEGLQHCLPHEWRPLIGGRSSEEKSAADIALPMRLAGEVAKFLWYPTGLWRDPHPITTTSISTTANSIHSKTNLSSPNHTDLLSSLRKHLHIHIIQGLSMHRSTTWPGKLILGCQLHDYERLLQCARYRNTIITIPNYTIQSAIFTNTVILQSNIGILGNRYQENNRDIGNSQQAREISIEHTITAEIYMNNLQKQREQRNKNERLVYNNSYIEDICHILQLHKIELVIAQTGALTLTLMDALTQYHIAVLQVASVRELDSVADLTGGGVIEDLYWLQAEDVGRQTVSIEYVLDLPVAYSPGGGGYSSLEVNKEDEGLCVGGRDVNRGDDVLQVGDQTVHQGLCLLSRNHSAIILPTDNVSNIDTFYVNNHHNNANLSESNHTEYIQSSYSKDADAVASMVALPVSVLLCAPTQAMCKTLHDRFDRCLHRLRSILQHPSYASSSNYYSSNADTAPTTTSISNNQHSHIPHHSNNNTDIKTGLMPGAGVPEMLCFLRTEEIITAFHTQHNQQTLEEGVVVQISILQLFQEILVQYILSICQNNAVSQSSAQEHLYLCLQQLRYQTNINTTAAALVEGSNVLTTVNNMTNSEKLQILAPISLSTVYDAPNLRNVLDSVSIKIAAIQNIIIVVKQIYYTVQV